MNAPRWSRHGRILLSVCWAVVASACNVDVPTAIAPRFDIVPQSNVAPSSWRLHVCKYGDGLVAQFDVSASSGMVMQSNPVQVVGVSLTAPPSCVLVWQGARGEPITLTVTEREEPGLILERIVLHGVPGAPGVTVTGGTVQVTEAYFESIGEQRASDVPLVYKNTAGTVPPTGRIGDFVWLDSNADGIQGADEPGLAGVPVTLVQNGIEILNTTTDASGNYLFTGLGAGCYSVHVATPSGMTPSPTGAGTSATDSNGSPADVCLPTSSSEDLTIDFGYFPTPLVCPAVAAVPALSTLSNWLFIFTDGSVDANWQGATKGFSGNVAVDGISARERTSGGVPYAGTIFTNDATLGAWQNIVNQNPGQAFASTGNHALIADLETSLATAFSHINGLAPNAPAGFTGTPTSLNGLNTQNGVAETFVIDVTSGFQVASKVQITGDDGDVFILRWDTDANGGNGYQGQVKFQSGGAIVPLGGLGPANFIHVAGDINASGGGSNPASPYPQGPGIPNGANWNGGGFFTGYWLTTGNAKRETASLSNAIFIGGWYSTTAKFSMTSGTSGVHVPCPQPD